MREVLASVRQHADCAVRDFDVALVKLPQGQRVRRGRRCVVRRGQYITRVKPIAVDSQSWMKVWKKKLK